MIYFPQIFDFLEDSLTTLKVYFLKDVKILRRILQKCQNIKTLWVDFSEVNSALPEKSFLSSSKTFDELKIEDGIFYLKIFQNVQVKKLIIKEKSQTQKIENLKKFLMTQKVLSDFELITNVENFQNLFYADFNVKFRLKNFSAIYLNNFNSINENYFENFLIIHEKSLESLQTFGPRLCESLKTFKNLKKLEIFARNVDDLIQLNQIEELKINLKNPGNWSENFKNVKNLKILARGFNFKEAEKLKKLEKVSVTFDSGWDHHTNTFYSMINLPRAKTIKIINFKSKMVKFAEPLEFSNFETFDWIHVKSPFEDENFKVENLILKNCHKFSWLGKYLKNDVNIQKLKIIGVERMTKKDKKILKKNQEKVEKILLEENQENFRRNFCL
jgi:hypothetical protein